MMLLRPGSVVPEGMLARALGAVCKRAANFLLLCGICAVLSVHRFLLHEIPDGPISI